MSYSVDCPKARPGKVDCREGERDQEEDRERVLLGRKGEEEEATGRELCLQWTALSLCWPLLHPLPSLILLLHPS